MKKNNIAQTRIQRYSKLREKIDQEIRDLKLKNENDARLNYYRNILNKIDPKIFAEASEKVDKLFPGFHSLIQAGEKNKDQELQVKKNEIKKWTEAIETVKEKGDQDKLLTNYVPDSNNEQFVKNIVQNWNKQRPQQRAKLEELIAIKQKFNTYKQDKTQSLETVNILQEVNEVNNQIDKLNNVLKKIIRIKKLKSRKWFWTIFTLMLISIACLIVIFLS